MANYTIRSGDTLSGIATRFNTSVAALAQLNGLRDPNRIQAGQALRIPDSFAPTPSAPVHLGTTAGATTYTVQAGDTLSGIAGRFGTTVSALASRNGIANPDFLRVGQRLVVGAGVPPPPTPPVTPAPGNNQARYTVQPGDTLSAIAARHSTTVGELVSLNGIRNANRIYPGQSLLVPGSGAPAPVLPTPMVGPTTGGVSAEQLRAIMPNLSAANAARYLPHLNRAMAEGGINTPKRQAAFLAQLAHESGQLRYFEEIASGAAYEGRRDLGNTQPGDGVRFKGRGPIQLTGRANYAAASRALGVDLVGNPELAATPELGFRVAQWFWNSRGLNGYADAGNFDAITYRVNGGYNGKASRDTFYARALAVLGA